MKSLSPRARAARAVAEVLRGGSLATALPPVLAGMQGPDRALAQELAFGACRFGVRYGALAQALISKPIKPKEAEVTALFYIGCYQLLEARIPAHAAVATTVEAAGELGRNWARGLLNATLRQVTRTPDLAQLAPGLDFETAHPAWLRAELTAAYGAEAAAVMAANLARPPLTLRVNPRRISRADYLAALTEAGLDAAPTPLASAGVTLAEPVPVERLPGFAEGWVSVQDEAAQLAVEVLAPAPGARVLDACAAPGGKTCHLLEAFDLAEVVALDADESRLARVGDNLRRLGLSATLKCGDGRAPSAWHEGPAFDAILLDAPCSATGVIRRHPDILHTRRASDIAALAALQGELLDALWPLLAPGGRLLYATCSVLPGENAEQITRFLARAPDARPLPVDRVEGLPAGAGRQRLPAPAGSDGFYYALLEKRA